MADNTSALLLPANGIVLIGAVGAAQPTQSAIDAFVSSGTAITGFSTIGHTSSDTVPSLEQDGGDITNLTTWLGSTVKTTIAATTDYAVVNVLQIDGTTMPLYYGGGTVADGSFSAPDSPAPQSTALLIIFMDPDHNIALYSYETQAIRSDSVDMATDSLASFPVQFSFIKNGTNPRFVWISDQFVAA